MRRSRCVRVGVAATGVLALTAGLLASGAGVAAAQPARDSSGHGATVYTESNAPSGNAVFAYHQNADGSVAPVGSFATDGNGTGAALGSQGAVTLDEGEGVLAAVNAGSNSISVFSVKGGGRLDLIDSAGSGGVDPISVTVHGRWVYVLNAGDASHAPSIAGLVVAGDHVRPRPNDVAPLNANALSPEQISFSPDGSRLVVTEKGSDTVDVFSVHDGDIGPAVTTTLPAGTGPYGFAFTPGGVAVISEAGFGGLGSYSITPQGALHKISEVADGQLAACWVALSSDGRKAYTANAHSGTVSFYRVAADGTLSLTLPAIATTPGAGDTDLAVAGRDSALEIFDGNHIDTASVSPTGTLGASNPTISGLPTGTSGLAATNG